MVRANGATGALDPGEKVTLDPQKGLVYRGSDESIPCPILSM